MKYECEPQKVIQHLPSGETDIILPDKDGNFIISPEEQVIYTEIFYRNLDSHREMLLQE